MAISLKANKYSTGLLGLLGDDNGDDNTKTFIIRKEKWNGGIYESHDVDSIHKLYERTPKKYKYFHEVILGEHNQKMKYDIDASFDKFPHLTKEKVLNNTIEAILKCYSELDYPLDLNQIILLDSCGETKLSFHIIIDKYYLSSNLEAKDISIRTQKLMSDELKGVIDIGVYKSIQNFRMVGCTKYKSDRYMELVRKWSHNGQIVENKIEDFISQTLITNTSNCDRMYVCIKTLNSQVYQEENGNIAMLPESYYESIVSHMFDNAFTISITPSRVNLNRISPSHCISCDRVHDSENAILYLKMNGDLMYKCWRGGVAHLIEKDATSGQTYIPDEETTPANYVSPDKQNLVNIVKRNRNIEAYMF